MKSIVVVLIVSLFIFSIFTLFTTPTKVLALTSRVDLLTTDNFAVLAGTAITSTGFTAINGDVGLSPAVGSSYTGLTAVQVIGTIYAVDNTGPAGSVSNPVLLTSAKNDLTTAYNDAAGRPTTSTIATQLGGTTLTDGVYNSASGTFTITGGQTLTLDGQGDPNAVFIFKMATTLTTGSASQVLLINNAQACNVYWQVGSSATLGTSTLLAGNILALTSITDNGTSTVNGRLLARDGAVTLNNTAITKQTCIAASPTPLPTSTPTLTPTPTLTISSIPTPISTNTPTPINNATPTSATALTSSSTVNSTSVSSSSQSSCPTLNTIERPIIIESKRIDASSIFISWGPYSGQENFNVQYGLTNGEWLYNTDVTGFSTTINSLPANQPIWIHVAARNSCSIGIYGESKVVGGPSLPSTGLGPHKQSVPWFILVGMFLFKALKTL